MFAAGVAVPESQPCSTDAHSWLSENKPPKIIGKRRNKFVHVRPVSGTLCARVYVMESKQTACVNVDLDGASRCLCSGTANECYFGILCLAETVKIIRTMKAGLPKGERRLSALGKLCCSL